jgi:guanylate kinase
MGTLELLCGPSGVGKTSLLDGVIKSYRWTTRPKRENETDSREYDGQRATHGFFVNENEFLARAEKGELAGVHRYPNPNSGYWYGFPINEIKSALEIGENLSEQIVTYEAIDDVVKAFEKNGTVIKKLFLASLEDIRKRRNIGRKTSDKERDKQDIEIIAKYLNNLDNFDDIQFIYPSSAERKEAIKIIDNVLNISETTLNAEQEYEVSGELISFLKKESADLREKTTIMNNLDRKEFIMKNISLLREYPDGKSVQTQNCLFCSVIPNNAARMLRDVLGVADLEKEIKINRHQKYFNRIDEEIRSVAETGKIKINDFVSRPIKKYLIDQLEKVGNIPAYSTVLQPFLTAVTGFSLITNFRDYDPNKFGFILGDCLMITSERSIIFEALDKMCQKIAVNFGTVPDLTVLTQAKGFQTLFNENAERKLKYMYKTSELISKDKQIMETVGNDLLDSTKSYLASFPVEISYSSSALDTVLHTYCIYNDILNLDDTLGDLFEVFKFMLTVYDKTEAGLIKYSLFINNRFVENLMRIKQSDRSKPYSRDNLFSYPYVGNARDFLQEYWIFDFPPYEEIRGKFEKNLAKLESMLVR